MGEPIAPVLDNTWHIQNFPIWFISSLLLQIFFSSFSVPSFLFAVIDSFILKNSVFHLLLLSEKFSHFYFLALSVTFWCIPHQNILRFPHFYSCVFIDNSPTWLFLKDFLFHSTQNFAISLSTSVATIWTSWSVCYNCFVSEGVYCSLLLSFSGVQLLYPVALAPAVYREAT